MQPFVSMLAVDIESVAVKVRVGLAILYCNESGGDECSEWVVTAVWMAGAAAAVTSGQARRPVRRVAARDNHASTCPYKRAARGGRGTCNQSPPLQQQHGFRDLQMKIRNYVLGWRCCQIHRSDLVEIRVPFTKEILTCCSQQANGSTHARPTCTVI